MRDIWRRVGGVVAGAALLALVVAATSPDRAPIGAAGTPGATPAACATPVASPGASPISLEGSGFVAVAETVTIRLTDEGFVPNFVQTTSGHDLTITLINTGTREHGFAIERFDIDERLQPGETKVVTIHNRRTIDVEYVSNAPCDEGMKGELTFFI